jgi:hypothetical protein
MMTAIVSGNYISAIFLGATPVQMPFKARLENMALSSYRMYWSVDGGQLNLMTDNTVGGDHKEASVDLSGWTWRDAGTAWGHSLSFYRPELVWQCNPTESDHDLCV